MSTQGGISIPLPSPKIRKGPIGRFFRRIKIWTETLFTPEGQARVDKTLGKVFDLLLPAIRVVERIALATPTKSDDEIVAILKRYQLPMVEGSLTDHQKRLILREAAVAALRELLLVEYALGGVKARILNTAIETAYVIFRAGQGDEA